MDIAWRVQPYERIIDPQSLCVTDLSLRLSIRRVA